MKGMIVPKKTLTAIVASYLGINTVSAYIDPGTGASAIGSMLPMLFAFLSAIGAWLIKHFWNPIKKFFAGK